MATTNLGRIALIPKGEWIAGATYKRLDVVRYGTGSFICLTLTTSDPTNNTDWQLLASDGPQGVAGAGVSNFATQTKMFSFVGALQPTTGTARFYPPQNITLNKVYMAVGGPSLADITINLKKNGTTICTHTLGAGGYKTVPQDIVATSVTTNDFLTVDLVTLGGANLTITLVYS